MRDNKKIRRRDKMAYPKSSIKLKAIVFILIVAILFWLIPTNTIFGEGDPDPLEALQLAADEANAALAAAQTAADGENTGHHRAGLECRPQTAGVAGRQRSRRCCLPGGNERDHNATSCRIQNCSNNQNYSKGHLRRLHLLYWISCDICCHAHEREQY